MATYQAIGSVAEGVRRLLEQSWTSTPGGLEPEFAVYHGTDFGTPMKTGISIFVYQVGLDPVQRTLPPSSPDRVRENTVADSPPGAIRVTDKSDT